MVFTLRCHDIASSFTLVEASAGLSMPAAATFMEVLSGTRWPTAKGAGAVLWLSL